MTKRSQSLGKGSFFMAAGQERNRDYISAWS